MAGLIAPESKILRHPETLAQLRRGESPWPVNVEFDLTNICQLKCQHCDFEYTHDGTIMPADLAIRVLVDLARGGTRAVTFTGGGEPTLHPLFAEFCHAASKLGLAVGVYTNGVKVKRLLAAMRALRWVYVSLDALGAISYKETKGVDLFDLVTDGIRLLARAKRSTTLGLGFLLHKDNYQFEMSMINLARDLGVDYCQFRPVVQEGMDYGWIPAALELLGRHSHNPDVYVSRQRFLDLHSGQARGYTVCRGSALVPCVGADGTLWVCPNTRGKRALGNLKSESFAEIWARRPVQTVGEDCRMACRNHALNETLEYVCGEGAHDAFV